MPLFASTLLSRDSLAACLPTWGHLHQQRATLASCARDLPPRTPSLHSPREITRLSLKQLQILSQVMILQIYTFVWLPWLFRRSEFAGHPVDCTFIYCCPETSWSYSCYFLAEVPLSLLYGTLVTSFINFLILDSSLMHRYLTCSKPDCHNR